MTQRSYGLLVILFCLACVTSACGKYGPPTRIGAGTTGAVAAGANAEAECEDEEKQPEKQP
jgi:hypothetical protein